MNNKKTIISLVAVLAVAAGVVGIAAMNRTPSTPVSTDTTTPVTTNPSTTTPVADKPGTTATANEYKDGTYTATGTYRSPGGTDNLTVTATIKNDIVTAATVTSGAHDGTSSRYQAMFISGYQPLVVGKSVDSIHLNAVSGSSLTGIGFNDAFAQIKAQAKA